MHRSPTSTGHGVFGRILGLVALAFTVVVVPTGAARAAASLVAIPNPVPIPSGQTVGSFDLTWDSGTASGIELVIARSGQAPDPPVALPATGSMPIDIELAEIVTVTMQPVGGGRPLVRPLTVTAISAGPPDVIDCTAAVCAFENTVDAHGTWAMITTGIADVKDVTVEVIDPDGKTVAAVPMVVNGNSATVDIFGLSAQTKYEYVIRVLDNLGNTTDEISSVFVTLERIVELTFGDFTLIDDSDDLTDAELDLWYTVGPVDWQRWNTGDRLGWGTGHVQNLAATTTVTGAPAVMPFAFFVEDDDVDVTSGLCSMGPQLGSTDEDACYSWITVEGSIDSTPHTGPMEHFQVASVMFGSNDDDLEFAIAFVANVTYK